MPIEVVEVRASADAKLNLDALTVSVVGNTITVSAGTITVEDLEDYAFPESEYVHTVDGANIVGLTGFIVRDTSDDSLQLFVDEFVFDGGDVPYDFSSGTLVNKFMIFNWMIQVGADAVDANEQQAFKTKQWP
jgi:hypothetical protein